MKYIGNFSCKCGLKRIVAGNIRLQCSFCNSHFLRNDWTNPSCPICNQVNTHLNLPEEHCLCGKTMLENDTEEHLFVPVSSGAMVNKEETYAS